MQQPSTEDELDKLTDLCGSLRLHDQPCQVADNLLEPIASILDAESAAFRHLDLRQSRLRILNLTSIGVANSVSDDYLAHFHRFDPFLERLTSNQDETEANAGFPETGQDFQSYFRNFLEPNGLVHHAGFMLRDTFAQQAWVFNFHRSAGCPEFAALELARARLIEAFLQGQISSPVSVKSRIPKNNHFSALTSREHEVVMAIASGYANKEIAQRLEISPRTVENHLRNIYEKLQVNTRTQLLSILHTSDYSPVE